MTGLSERELDLIGLIYDAALEPKGWRAVLEEIKEMAGIDGCDMYFYDSQYRSRTIVASAVASDKHIKKYLDHHIENEVRIVSERYAEVPEGTFIEANEIARIQNKKYEENFDNQYQNEVLYDGIYTRAGILIKNGFILNSIMGFKCFANSPPISQDSMNFLKRIGPHVVQSLEIYNHISSLEQTFSSLHSILDGMHQAVFLIDSQLQTIFSNKRAGELINSNAGLKLGKGGRLSHSSPKVDELLITKLNSTLQNYLPQGGVSVSLPDIRGLKPLSCNLIAIHPDHDTKFGYSGARIAAYISAPNISIQLPRDYLKLAYNLTGAEIDAAQIFVSEGNIGKIPEKKFVCKETARWLIKRIFEKTNTHSQPELMKLLIGVASEVV